MTTFYAEVAPTDNALQFGDAGRIEIWSKPTIEDNTAALALMAMKRKVLRLKFSTMDGSDACEFLASIVPQNSALRFGSRAKARFDIPETELLQAARLVGYQGQALRLEVLIEGEKPEKPKVQKLRKEQPAKGEWGSFWRYLWNRNLGLLTHPDMTQAFTDAREELSKPLDYPLEELVRDMFGVTSRTFISPDDLRRYLSRYGLSEEFGVLAMIRQAERVTAERRAA